LLNEVGVIGTPEGRQFSCAAFAHAKVPYERQTEIVEAIGPATALALASIRVPE
jgi:hypothetical protein